MCFSAPASFLAAGVTGVIGIGCLAKARSPREWPLAAMPLLFSAQQAIEGWLWLTLPVAPHDAQATVLTLVFLIFAKAFWPAYAPMTVWLVEPDPRRRTLIGLLALGGLAVGIFFLRGLLANDQDAQIIGGHIAYGGVAHLPLSVAALYLLATCAAPLLSSHAPVRLMAVIVTVGAAITYAFYWQAFSSVWCFFAAAASAVILAHFASASSAVTSASRVPSP